MKEVKITNCVIIGKGEERKVFDTEKTSCNELAKYLYDGWTIRKYCNYTKKH